LEYCGLWLIFGISESMKSKIIQQIKDKFANTNGGITAIQLMELNDLTYSEIKPIIVELQQEKVIKVKQGINNKLIFLRDGK